MRLTKLAESLDGVRWRCNVCQWRCHVSPGEVGRCLVRVGTPRGIAVTNDRYISAANVSLIEDHRLWHLFPGTPVLTLGSWGYAFPADQQHGEYRAVPEQEQQLRQLEPDRAATFALERLCRGVVWAFSDPSVSHEYLLDLLQSARANSRYTAMVSTGYLTIEALDQIGHYLDALSLDLRAFDNAAYTRLAGVEHWRGILVAAAHAKQRWHCHVEVTTRLHPAINDGPDQVHTMARWIRDTLGPHTAWHVLPGDAGAAAAASVGRTVRIGREAGLHFVYGTDPHQPTYCPSCGAVVVERSPDGGRILKMEGSHCRVCGHDLHFRTSIWKQ